MGNTRQQMIEIGARLLRQQGYNATTLVQVVEEGGLPRGSIYHHFPGGKPQLAREAISYAAAQVAVDMAAVAEAAKDPSEAIAFYFNLLADRLEASGFVDGCWYATTALEVDAGQPELRDIIGDKFAEWQQLTVDGLIGWGVAADKAQASASLVIAAMEGGVLRSRISRDANELRSLIPSLQQFVQRADRRVGTEER